MDYRKELAIRLAKVPFTAAAIARTAGLSREWVSKARRGRAPKLTLETAQKIHAAVDHLLSQAGSELAPAPDHPGVAELIASPELQRRHHVTTEELRDLAELRLIGGNGDVLTIPDAAAAVQWLQALRSAERHPREVPNRSEA